MTTGHLVNRETDETSVQSTQPLYDQKLIPAEKKPFLIDLRHSGGPFMAVANGHFILDVASQIASLGLGFNAGAMFGAAQFLESWTGNQNTDAICAVRKAFHQLLLDLSGWPQMHLQLCNSGAEANELALGICYQQRKDRQAKKVLGFEGAFHGRMMITLASTWNIKKRAPFAWHGYETSFAPYPEMETGDVGAPIIPAQWQRVWAQSHQQTGEQVKAAVLRQFGSDDSLLQQEIHSLLKVHELLTAGGHYAVLLEPMQCEGGDRYSSSRFHHGLINLVKGFGIPLVYDEIQTGFGLGGDFFWHRKFQLQDAQGAALYPDHVVLAKKAQVGAVLSHRPCDFVEQYNAASLTRGFIQASMIDQFHSEIERMEKRTREELNSLLVQFEPAISRPRVNGMCFAFDFQDPEQLKQFVSRRFYHGLLYYPAGDRAARFRLNLACRGEVLDLIWQQIRAALSDTLESKPPVPAVPIKVPNTDAYFTFHQRFISAKLKGLHHQPPAANVAMDFLTQAVEDLGIEGEVVFLDPSNWQQYRQQVWDMQAVIYEPLRQTEIGKFDQLMEAENSLAFLLLKDQQIIAMAFAAPPINFPKERGLSEDRFFEDPETLYMLDLTVIPKYQGKLGRLMKQTLCLAAQARGRHAVQGRNRDRIARGMWAINLSLGAFGTDILRDDYLDEQPFRDCLMYRCGLVWQDEPISLSTGVERPLEAIDLNEGFCQSNLPSLPNKLTLSNFVTADYLQQLERVFGLLPNRLRHGYSASGMSECVDKLVKTLWLQRQPRNRMLRIGDPFFGHGSFLARSLSGSPDPLFPCTSLANDEQLLGRLKVELTKDDVLGVFIEPLQWEDGERIDLQKLERIQACCRDYGTPLVTNDSAGMFHRYHTDSFLPAALDSFRPDAGLLYLGGQMAVCFMREGLFEETPLMFISTWDGDLFSLSQFEHALATASKQNIPRLVERYQIGLRGHLQKHGVTKMSLTGSSGWFEGTVDETTASMFRKNKAGRFISCPSITGMTKFLAWLEEQEDG
ncbi:MAG: aminotransferase class III-fold pyridoxal phosphate-dependent enzyme [Pirellulaceae bacterium]|nr:aminotransferase class III-fold pyridoxal phosphate-dependent enzyme [Pirellulaceae bacterium]